MALINDKHFQVGLVSRTPNAQTSVYLAMHQDYYEGFALSSNPPSDSRCGCLSVQHLLKGDRGHYGPLEHPQIIVNVGGFPHSVMAQLRTHRTGCSFDVQSGRYTGLRYKSAFDRLEESDFDFAYTPGVWCGTDYHREIIEQVIYLRPEGEYQDRQGHRYWYTPTDRDSDLALAAHLLYHYSRKIDKGHSEEHARGMFPYEFRQNFVLSMNLRSMMHILDLRAKKDAQLECQAFCDHLIPHFENWTPEIYSWYKETRWGKARLAP